MNQHTPDVNRSDVERVIRRDYPNEDFDEISRMLEAYGRKEYHREVDRVHLDILKLADGKKEKIEWQVEEACCDFRDVVLCAEYPNYGKKMFRIDKLPEEEKEKLIIVDRDQYEAWLHKIEPKSEPGRGGNG